MRLEGDHRMRSARGFCLGTILQFRKMRVARVSLAQMLQQRVGVQGRKTCQPFNGGDRWRVAMVFQRMTLIPGGARGGG
jgi:hypothetical protein